VLLLADLLVAIGAGMCNVCGVVLLGKAAPAERVGAFMGVSESAQGLAGTIFPAIGGYLHQHYGDWAPGALSGVLCCLALATFVLLSDGAAAAGAEEVEEAAAAAAKAGRRKSPARKKKD